MTFFIIFSSQKTGGWVVGNRTLHSVVHIYLHAACLLRGSCTKKRALNYIENVNKDQNCDRLNFIFVHFSLENEDVYCI